MIGTFTAGQTGGLCLWQSFSTVMTARLGPPNRTSRPTPPVITGSSGTIGIDREQAWPGRDRGEAADIDRGRRARDRRRVLARHPHAELRAERIRADRLGNADVEVRIADVAIVARDRDAPVLVVAAVERDAD